MELFEQTDMEHVMQTSSCRQLEPVSHVADLLRDLKWPEELDGISLVLLVFVVLYMVVYC
jgi:hypothetical protein